MQVWKSRGLHNPDTSIYDKNTRPLSQLKWKFVSCHSPVSSYPVSNTKKTAFHTLFTDAFLPQKTLYKTGIIPEEDYTAVILLVCPPIGPPKEQ